MPDHIAAVNRSRAVAFLLGDCNCPQARVRIEQRVSDAVENKRGVASPVQVVGRALARQGNLLWPACAVRRNRPNLRADPEGQVGADVPRARHERRIGDVSANRRWHGKASLLRRVHEGCCLSPVRRRDNQALARKERQPRAVREPTAIRLRALVLLLHYSGLRSTDAATLSRNRITGDKLLLYTAKTGTPVFCPLPPVVIGALGAIPEKGLYLLLVRQVCNQGFSWQHSVETATLSV
jgi:hypothetical protein